MCATLCWSHTYSSLIGLQTAHADLAAQALPLTTCSFTTRRREHDLTYSDVFLVPGRSSVGSRLDVSLASSDGTGTTIPVVSANMNSVTGPRLAATLARRGGLGVLPQDLHLQDLDTAIRWVKDQPVAFDTPIVLGPEQTVAAALRLVPAVAGHGIVVRDADGDVPRLHLAPAHARAPRCRMRGSATSLHGTTSPPSTPTT